MPRKLKSGFTTGTAAAAATKGALSLLLRKKAPSKVQIELLTGDCIDIFVKSCLFEDEKTVTCTIVKDAGDDPDITHKAKICARVTCRNNDSNDDLLITGGKGVGMVTKPGLEILPGKPAINPGPLKMITKAVDDVLKKYNKNLSVKVEIFVPEGEIMAQKTLNPRLGILGGISILGTTGIVKPMSHEAYIATIKSSLSVARASGIRGVVMTTGRRSERYAQVLLNKLPDDAFIQIGDFFKMSLEMACRAGLKKITLAVFFGKALKMAQGIPHTHAAKSAMTMHKLSEWSLNLTNNKAFAKKILSANTARHALEFLLNEYPEVVSHVGKLVVQSATLFANIDVYIRGIIFDYNANVIFDSDSYLDSV